MPQPSALSINLLCFKKETLFLKYLMVLLLGFCIHSATFATIFTVTNTTNSNPGSFRAQLIAANASPGLDTLDFSVSGTVNVLSTLPAITSPVFIDGTSAPGYVACGSPQIVINGSGAGTSNGIQLLAGASGSTLLALNVSGFSLNGIQLIGSTANTIQRCFVGVNQTGTAAMANGLNGFQLEGGSDNNRIGGPIACEGNLISGNGGWGISLNNSSTTTIMGNLIGMNATGTGGIGNGGAGIGIINGSNNTQIGGSGLTERNIVSNNGTGFSGNGIDINGATGTVLLNNYIGLDPTGTVPMGNAENGLSLNAAPNTTIGGTGTLDGNRIADHNFHGIVLNGGSSNIDILGNVIGTNAAGTLAFGNDDSGVIVINSSNVRIGGTATGAGNLLSGSLSEYGVFVISASDVVMEGNNIGTDITGTLPLPNFDGGVRIDFNSNDNTVGGTATGASNIIAFNTGYAVGILSADCARNLVSRNAFFCNTGDGIELNNLGNNNYASPIITAFSTSGIAGTAQAGDEIELFYDSLCAGNCQGKDFIASVTANAVGNWSYTGPLNGSATVLAIAIRTAAPATTINNTSEATCQVILPVEWASFEARPMANQQVQLSWATTAEENNRHFEVERSADGGVFTKIGEVTAIQGSLGNPYEFRDVSPLPGTNFYRLKQVDFDGSHSWSATREVHFGQIEDQFEIASNPADASLRFRLSSFTSAEFTYRLIDPTGSVVLHSSGQGQDWTEIPTDQLASGIYLLHLLANGIPITRKVVIQH